MYIENGGVTCWHGDEDHELLISVDIPWRSVVQRWQFAVEVGVESYYFSFALTTRIWDSAMIVLFE